MIAEANTEDVTLTRSSALQCTADGIEAEVQYTVSRLQGGNGGGKVSAIVTADGAVVAEGEGKLGKPLAVLIPVANPSC